MGPPPDACRRKGFVAPRRNSRTMLFAASPGATIESALLRKNVGLLTDARPHCHHCHRTPLVGERVYLYASALVCELCRPRRRDAPQRSELVRSPEHRRAVRVRRPGLR